MPRQFVRENLGRMLVSFSLLACLFWGAWSLHQADVASLRDRTNLRHEHTNTRTIVDRNTEAIAELIAITRQRDDKAQKAIALIGDLKDGQERIIEAIQNNNNTTTTR